MLPIGKRAWDFRELSEWKAESVPRVTSGKQSRKMKRKMGMMMEVRSSL